MSRFDPGDRDQVLGFCAIVMVIVFAIWAIHGVFTPPNPESNKRSDQIVDEQIKHCYEQGGIPNMWSSNKFESCRK